MATTLGSSAQPRHTPAYSSDLRWHMVYQKELVWLTCRQVGKNLNVDASTVGRVTNRFHHTGDVDGCHRVGQPTALTVYDEFVILGNALSRPATYVQ